MPFFAHPRAGEFRVSLRRRSPFAAPRQPDATSDKGGLELRQPWGSLLATILFDHFLDH
jgi:hypothetical protein